MNMLFVCNTVYQVLVASWIKYKLYPNERADIVVSNHMNGNERIAENIKKTDLFNTAFTVNSKSYVYEGKRIYNNRFSRYYYYRFPSKELEHYIKLDKYDVLFFSNYDRFNALIYDVLKRKNKNLICNVFEDGLATYGKITEDFYNIFKPSNNPLIRFIFNNIFRTKRFYNNINGEYVFEKKLCEWVPNCPIIQIEKIDINDSVFKKKINIVFDYNDSEDQYNEKYIFFEESFFADDGYMEDVKLVQEVAKHVGVNNLIVKIHPRNPKNRFKELGFKTNSDLVTPLEVILLNRNFSNKTLLALYSTTIVTPYYVFGMNINAYSLAECLKNKPSFFNNEFSKKVFSIYEQCGVKICNDIKTIL